MSMLAQQIAIIAAVVLAVAYVVYHYARKRRQKLPCANCAAMHALKNRPKSSVHPPIVRN